MKKYFVIYSADPYLLARLCTDLQMEGYPLQQGDVEEELYNPFADSSHICRWLKVNQENTFGFYNHDCDWIKNRYGLTSKNYLSVLTQILEP